MCGSAHLRPFRAVLRMHGSNNSKTSHESCSATTFRMRALRVVIIVTCARSSIRNAIRLDCVSLLRSFCGVTPEPRSRFVSYTALFVSRYAVPMFNLPF